MRISAPRGVTSTAEVESQMSVRTSLRTPEEGVFVLRDEVTGCVRTTDVAMADQGFSPKSTFKIPNALIGLETGVIEGW